MKRRTAIGSSAFLVLLVTLSVATNLIFNVICLVCWILGLKVMIVVNCSGFWLIVFSLMVVECMRNPNSLRTLLCIPLQFPSKYFPLVLYIFFCLFSGPQLDLACALGVGYMYSQNYMDRWKFSQSDLVSAESVGILRVAAINLSHWVSTSAALGYDVSQHLSVDSNGATQQEQSSLAGTYAFPSSEGSSKPGLFPGAGQIMGFSVRNSNTSAWLPTNVDSVNTATASREEVASRRLAALSNDT